MDDVLLYGPLGLFAVLVVLDVARPARAFPKMRGWRITGLAFYALYGAVALGLPLLWDRHLAELRVIDATGLGTIGGAIAGLLALELGVYAWHRTMHNVPVLWRWLHQLHHSPERVDVFGAFYFSPLDMAGFTLVSSLCLVLVVGVSREAAMIANTAAYVLGTFQHANLRTPRWLGLFVSRPEMHAIHHERGVHAFNYGDMPLWDMVFGTYRNPATWSGEVGFYDGASRRVSEMLLGRDVSREP